MKYVSNSKSAKYIPFAFLLFEGTCFGAQSTPISSSLSYNFETKSIVVYGVHSATRGKTGLDAELAARQDGVNVITQYLEKSCSSADSNSPKSNKSKSLSDNWQRAVKSQGSEIYANGVLRIILVAHLREVFKKYNSTKPLMIENDEGKSVVFQLPTIPPDSVHCGMLKLAVSPRQIVNIIPLPVNSGDQEIKIVKLTLSDSGILQSAKGEEADFIQKTELGRIADNSETVVGLPILKK